MSWHSKDKGSSRYHICEKCVNSRRIKPENLRSGTGDRELCVICQIQYNAGPEVCGGDRT